MEWKVFGLLAELFRSRWRIWFSCNQQNTLSLFLLQRSNYFTIVFQFSVENFVTSSNFFGTAVKTAFFSSREGFWRHFFKVPCFFQFILEFGQTLFGFLASNLWLDWRIITRRVHFSVLRRICFFFEKLSFLLHFCLFEHFFCTSGKNVLAGFKLCIPRVQGNILMKN